MLYLFLKENIKLSFVLPNSPSLCDFHIEGLYPPIISSVSFTLMNVTVWGILSHNSWNFSGVNPSRLPLNNKLNL